MELALELLTPEQVDAILAAYASLAEWYNTLINSTSSIVVEDIPM